MRIQRTGWITLALAALVPGVLRAQQGDTSSAQRTFEARRAELVKELQQTQDQLGQMRSERVKLEAQIEGVLAQQMQQRATQLMMTNEQNALLQLDGLLASAQDQMTSQRDRMQALGESVKQRTGAVLVVLFKVDSAASTAQVGPVELTIDDVPATHRSYSDVAMSALKQGAVDQLFRSEVLPTAHAITAKLSAGGQSVTQSLSVNAPAETVTYVQFSLRNGQLVPVTWTAKGTSPF